MTSDNRQQTTDNRGKQQTTDDRDRSSLRSPSRRVKYSFRDLAVWQKAQELSLVVLHVVRALPGDRASMILGQQLLKSATSIAANIAEGHGRFAAGAYRNHLSIARGSGNETLSWLDLLRRGGYISPEREEELMRRCDEILRMISAQMIELDRQTGSAKAFRDVQEEYVTD